MNAIPHPLAAHARARPHFLAIIGEGCTRTYGELAQEAAQAAACYHARGVRSGDRVAVLGPPHAAMACVIHALGWLGAVVVPLPISETQANVQARIGRAQAVHAVVLDDAPEALQAACHQALGAKVLPACTLRLCPDCGKAPSLWPEHDWLMDAPRLVLQTSGTSGAPTCVVLSVSQMLMHTVGSTSRLGHAIDDVWLNVLPLHHVGGLMILFRALWMGVTVRLPGRFDAADTAQAMQDGSVTLVSLVPTMLARVLPLFGAKGCSSRLRAVLLGGAPTPQALLDAALAHTIPVAITWGMTETASQVCTQWPGTCQDAQNAGPPLPFAHVWVADSGALCVGGPIVSAPLVTGDAGTVDATGCVHVHGRRDRVLISGGENIAPEEVEAVLLGHAEIADAAVVGAPDLQWGERPVAHLVATQAPLPSDVLVAFCRARLASFKVPVAFYWHDALPRDGMGKLQRASLTCDAALKEQ